MTDAQKSLIIGRYRKALKKGYRIIRKSEANTPEVISVLNLKKTYPRNFLREQKRFGNTFLDIILMDVFNAGMNASNGGDGSGGNTERLMNIAKSLGVEINVESLLLSAIEKAVTKNSANAVTTDTAVTTTDDLNDDEDFFDDDEEDVYDEDDN